MQARSCKPTPAMQVSTSHKCVVHTLPHRRQQIKAHAAQPVAADTQPASRRSQLLGLGVGLATLLLPDGRLGVHGAAAADPSPPAIGEIANQIAVDFVQKAYYVTGNLSPELYDEGCVFRDPTTTVVGAKKYTDALKLLFNPNDSKAELISLKIDSPTRVLLRWRLEGALNFGPPLRIKPYTGTTTYDIDPRTGKIISHSEVWDISTLDAFVSTLIPGYGAPPAPPIEQIKADLIKSSFEAAGQPVPAGLKLK